jgi:hypothetical protein
VQLTIVAVEEVLHILSVFFLDLVIQHAMRMHHIVLCSVCGFALYFSTLSQMAKFLKEVIEHIMCILIFFTFFETFIILRTTEPYLIKIYNDLNVIVC